MHQLIDCAQMSSEHALITSFEKAHLQRHGAAEPSGAVADQGAVAQSLDASNPTAPSRLALGPPKLPCWPTSSITVAEERPASPKPAIAAWIAGRGSESARPMEGEEPARLQELRAAFAKLEGAAKRGRLRGALESGAIRLVRADYLRFRLC